MAANRGRRPVRLVIERLETRLAPSASHWLSESFDTTPVGGLPANWSQWGSDPSTAFAVSSAQAVSAPNSLAVTSGISKAIAEAWYNPVAAADVQVSASVLVNSLIPAQVIARGTGLGTSAPSFYAVQVVRGMEVDLVRVVNGVATSLAQLQSASWFSDRWAQITLSVSGSSIKAQVYRPDTALYLSAAGQWQAAQTWALTVTDTVISGTGQVGLGRASSYTGSVAFDDFTADLLTTSAPGTSVQSFDTTPIGSLPAGWSQWSNYGTNAFAVSSARALSAPNGLAVTAAASNLAATAWQTTPQPADVQVGAAVFLDGLIPAKVFARGTGLGTATPSYYAVVVTRGLEVDLVRVTSGATTTLAKLNSAGWFAGAWADVTLSVTGASLSAQVVRPDTGQYLNASGQWQSAQAWALTATDAGITGSGVVGLARPASYTGTLTFDDFSVTSQTTATTPPTTSSTESFDTTVVGSLPSGWTQFGSSFAVSAAVSLSAPNGLAASAASSSVVGRAWETASQPADVQVGAAVYLNSLIPAQVCARGSGLSGATPTYYAVALTRGLEVDLVREVNGVSTTLGTLNSASWFAGAWVRATLTVVGSSVSAQVFRPDTAQYLSNTGQWQAAPTSALTVTDSAISGSGLVGLARPASYSGTVAFDDFVAEPAASASQAPTVSITAPAAGAVLSGVTAVSASAASSASSITKVEFYVDNELRATVTTAPYTWQFDSSTASNATHTLAAWAYDLAGTIGKTSITVTTQNAGALPQPVIPQHYPNIRIAELAYNGGTGPGTFENQLLQNSVDLVIPDGQFSAQINAVAPNTPQLFYTNVSNLYGNLLLSWLNYADANGLSRESAFYHVTTATPFSGTSASSEPVTWFWGVDQGTTSLTDVTAAAHSGQAQLSLGAAGQLTYLGYPDPFRLINVNLASGAGSGWSGVLEYPTAVDGQGNPTAWATVPKLTDTTAGLTASGQITFDPPAGWVTASVNGSARMCYVRFRAAGSGSPAVVNSLLGDDYVNASGGTSGVIPAFDYAADVNHDGYLSDAEYAHRTPGMNARFAYQGRMFQPGYGQMRFATNPSNAGFRAWAVSYNLQYLNSQPLASGLFVDNSSGLLGLGGSGILESTSTYTGDYASLLNGIGQAIAPRWVMANIAGGSASSSAAVVQKVQGYFDEFLLRPLADSYQQVEAMGATLSQYAALTSPSAYAVLDSLPTGGSPTDSRTQLATLAYYYLFADPVRTFLDFYGGYDPSSSWTSHWSAAAAYNIGQPTGAYSLFASGTDPANAALTYRVYQRAYTGGLVLYKPLSADSTGATVGSVAAATATAISLGGTYRPVQPDGTLGTAITSITLRNGEGAILVKSS
jgi:hypothetical protein